MNVQLLLSFGKYLKISPQCQFCSFNFLYIEIFNLGLAVIKLLAF